MATILTINRSTPNDGLGDTLYVEAGKINDNFAELNTKKVEVVAGFGLSQNSYTDDEQTKLGGIEDYAQVNVQADWNQSDPDQDDYIKNKPTISSSDLFSFDGTIGVTAGFSVGQVAFILPSGANAKFVYLNSGRQMKTTANNSALIGRWSQTGDTVTITETTVLNDFIEILYE